MEAYEHFLALIHEEDRERIRSEFGQSSAAHTAIDTEFQITWPSNGSEHLLRMRSKTYCDRNANVSRIVGVGWDITERRETELALAKERNLLKTLMDHLPYAIYFKDLESRFIAVSRTLGKLHRRENPEELIGKTDHDVFSIEHADGALADEREIIRTGKPIIDYEEKETWPDRDDTWVSTTKMPLRDAQGKIIGTFGISRDITEKKRADERLAMLAAELRAKNESLEQDLEMARELQSALLPQRFPNFPHHVAEQDSAVRFYPFFMPSMIVSGDFFDVLDIADDKAGLFMCDVMGHGVRAALVAAIVRSVVSELRPLWTRPGELLVRYQSRTSRRLQEHGYHPLCFGVLLGGRPCERPIALCECRASEAAAFHARGEQFRSGGIAPRGRNVGSGSRSFRRSQVRDGAPQALAPRCCAAIYRWLV